MTACSTGLFITPDLPTIAPQRLGTTIQWSCRWGRIDARRPRAPASYDQRHSRVVRRHLQPFCQIQDPRTQNFWQESRIEGTNFHQCGGERPRCRPHLPRKKFPKLAVNWRSPSKMFGPPNENLSP
jgi:hypothetical protein